VVSRITRKREVICSRSGRLDWMGRDREAATEPKSSQW
jgi:hypothetical protein